MAQEHVYVYLSVLGGMTCPEALFDGARVVSPLSRAFRCFRVASGGWCLLWAGLGACRRLVLRLGLGEVLWAVGYNTALRALPVKPCLEPHRQASATLNEGSIQGVSVNTAVGCGDNQLTPPARLPLDKGDTDDSSVGHAGNTESGEGSADGADINADATGWGADSADSADSAGTSADTQTPVLTC